MILSGVLRIPLDEQSALLTIFITQFARFCCTRVPFGMTSEPEVLQKKMFELLDGIEGVPCIIDDILVHG